MKQQNNFTPQSVSCKTENIGIPKIPQLLYGKLEVDGFDYPIPVFNFTKYYEHAVGSATKNISKKDANMMMFLDMYRSMKKSIDSMAEMYSIPENMITFENEDGDMLVNQKLDMITVCYFNPSILTEAFDYLRDIYLDNFAIYEPILFQKCNSDISSDVLINILKDRGDL